MITLREADASTRRTELERISAELVEAGRSLREQPRGEIVDALAQVLEIWREPSSTWRQQLEAALPHATGFSPEAVRHGLALGLDAWTGDALRALLARELGQTTGSTGGEWRGFAITRVLLAGSIPMPSLLSLMAPLALGSPVLAKPASRDPVTPDLVARSIAAVDPELGRCIATVDFPGHDGDAVHTFLTGGDGPARSPDPVAGCVVASGSDRTIAAVEQPLGGSQRLVAYGHRLSIAMVGPDATLGEQLGEVAEGLALDTALWDQLGCLSPVCVYVVSDDPKASQRTAAALAEALEAAEGRWPRGELSATAAAAIRRERAEAQVRLAAGNPVTLHASPGSEWTVIGEADPGWRPAPLHRFLRVAPLGAWRPDDLGGLLAPLHAIGRHLSSVAVAGFPETQERALASALFELGAARICRPGRLQAPPLGWHRDGLPVLLPMARHCAIDSP